MQSLEAFERAHPPPPDLTYQERVDRYVVFRAAEYGDTYRDDPSVESYIAKAEATAAFRRSLARGAPAVSKTIVSTFEEDPYPLSVLLVPAAAGSRTAQALFDIKTKGLLSVELLRQGRSDDALDMFSEAHLTPDTFVHRFDVLVLPKFLEIARTRLRRDPKDVHALSASALLLMKQRQLPLAIAALTDAACAARPALYFTRATLYQLTGDVPSSIRSMDALVARAPSLSPRDPSLLAARLFRGHHLFNRKEFLRALPDFMYYTEHEEPDARSLSMGLCYLAMTHLAAAGADRNAGLYAGLDVYARSVAARKAMLPCLREKDRHPIEHMADAAFAGVTPKCSRDGCTNPGANKCARCQARYCSEKCQKVDWKARHKLACAAAAPAAAAAAGAPA